MKEIYDCLTFRKQPKYLLPDTSLLVSTAFKKLAVHMGYFLLLEKTSLSLREKPSVIV